MEPIISEPIEFTFVGISKLDQSDIGTIWNMFVEMEDQIQYAEKDFGYELHIFPDRLDKSQEIVVMVSYNVDKVEKIPLPMMIKKLPKTKYAIFDYHVKDGDYSWINNQIDTWIESSKYQISPNYSIQRYDQRFKGMEDEQSIIQFYIPIKPKDR